MKRAARPAGCSWGADVAAARAARRAGSRSSMLFVRASGQDLTRRPGRRARRGAHGRDEGPSRFRASARVVAVDDGHYWATIREMELSPAR